MKISICVNTARGDYPMQAYPNLHMFEYFMRSLRQQTFKDFEVVIADVMHDTRSDYFIKNPESFPVQHVPVKPNIWVPKGYCAISTTKNTCLLYAKGEIVVFTDDCCSLPPDYLERILTKITPKIGVSNMYRVCLGEEVLTSKKDPRPEGFITGTYGNVALYLDAFLDVNGYNEIFDGTRGLEDCDFSRRVYNNGIQWWLMACHATFQLHNQNYPKQVRIGPRCPRTAEGLSISTRLKTVKANTIPLTQEELDIFQRCNKEQAEKTKCYFAEFDCSRWLSWPGAKEDIKDFNLYTHPSLIFDLREQRKDVNKTLLDLQELCKGVI